MKSNPKYHPKCPADCCECCRRGQVIVLFPSEVERFPKKDRRKKTFGKHKVQALRIKPNGDCIYLEDGECTVYNRRPKICKTFDPGSWACKNVVEAAKAKVKDRGMARYLVNRHQEESEANGREKDSQDQSESQLRKGRDIPAS